MDTVLTKQLSDILAKVQDCGIQHDTANRITAYIGNVGVARWLIENGITIPVLCKDCKHRAVAKNTGEYFCANPYYGMASGVELKDDDFCSYGERKDDVVEVVHGRWIICSDGYYPYCSVCNEESKHGEMTSFCLNCGAKMDLKD